MLYLGDHYEVENNVAIKYIFGGNLRLAQIKGSLTSYFHKDHLGSTAAITDQNGNKVEGTTYEPFGSTRVHEGTNTSAYKFTDHEADVETGLYNYDARLYDPVLGMFVTPDSIVPRKYDPQILNRYAYCRNNPLIYTDPSGHKITGPFDGNEYSFSICVDQPGVGGDYDINEGTDVGHCFVEVKNQTTGETVAAGKHHALGFLGDLAVVAGKTVGGVVEDDTGHDWDVKKDFGITKVDYDKLKKEIEEDKKNTSGYNLGNANCVDYGVRKAKSININSLPGNINVPGPFGELLALQGGRRNEGFHPGIGHRSNDLDRISGL